jgi:hypothetical protein
MKIRLPFSELLALCFIRHHQFPIEPATQLEPAFVRLNAKVNEYFINR